MGVQEGEGSKGQNEGGVGHSLQGVPYTREHPKRDQISRFGTSATIAKQGKTLYSRECGCVRSSLEGGCSIQLSYGRFFSVFDISAKCGTMCFRGRYTCGTPFCLN